MSDRSGGHTRTRPAGGAQADTTAPAPRWPDRSRTHATPAPNSPPDDHRHAPAYADAPRPTTDPRPPREVLTRQTQLVHQHVLDRNRIVIETSPETMPDHSLRVMQHGRPKQPRLEPQIEILRAPRPHMAIESPPTLIQLTRNRKRAADQRRRLAQTSAVAAAQFLQLKPPTVELLQIERIAMTDLPKVVSPARCIQRRDRRSDDRRPPPPLDIVHQPTDRPRLGLRVPIQEHQHLPPRVLGAQRLRRRRPQPPLMPHYPHSRKTPHHLHRPIHRRIIRHHHLTLQPPQTLKQLSNVRPNASPSLHAAITTLARTPTPSRTRR